MDDSSELPVPAVRDSAGTALVVVPRRRLIMLCIRCLIEGIGTAPSPAAQYFLARLSYHRSIDSAKIVELKRGSFSKLSPRMISTPQA